MKIPIHTETGYTYAAVTPTAAKSVGERVFMLLLSFSKHFRATIFLSLKKIITVKSSCVP